MGKPTSTKVVAPTHNPQWDRWSYRIGCPVWACREWNDQVYPASTRPEDYLKWYSRAFPTVEGNSTFYAVPSQATFEKWVDATPASFQFCFKFPRRLSHDLKLTHCDSELKLWLERLQVVYDHGRLGPTFLQLAPSYSFAHFPTFRKFLEQLPSDWPWAVELRHRDWFDEGDCEARLTEFLRDREIDRVLFDSRPLNSGEASDESETASQARKPKSPFRTAVTGKRPMLRLIGRNNAAEIVSYWEEWSLQIAAWIRDGLQPWIFTHAPDDAFAPGLARLLHDFVRLHLNSLAPLPNLTDVASPASCPGSDKVPIQMDLF